MTDTIYSGSVTDFRRQLVASAQMFDKMHKPHAQKVMNAMALRQPGSHAALVPDSVRDADLSGLMAGTYAYTLAAMLRVAEREFGHDVAARLACCADDILTNGDDHDLNADVAPAAEVPGA